MNLRIALGLILVCMMFLGEDQGFASFLRHKKKHSSSTETNAAPGAVESGGSTNEVSSVTNAPPVNVSVAGQDLLPMKSGTPSDKSIAWAAEREDMFSLRRMLAQKAPVDSRDAQGYTALIWAAVNANPLMARLLVENGANVNVCGKDGRTPLMYSVMNGPAEVVELLLDKGADVNAQDDDGSTALIWGAALGKTETVSSVLKRKPSLDAKDKRGRTALMWADVNQHRAVAKLLRDAGGKAVPVP